MASRDDDEEERLAELYSDVAERYIEKFGEMPPVAQVRTPRDQLVPLMEKAVESGERLTAKTLAKATGKKLPPRAAIV